MYRHSRECGNPRIIKMDPRFRGDDISQELLKVLYVKI
jgi:hypothetical protein